MTIPELIDTPATLDRLCAQLREDEVVAVDTEFIRERTYFPRLGLVQVAGASTIACVDAIALDDLSPLMSVLLDTTITKVLHAARQDYEIFVQLTGDVPAPVFDTQIAADLCGLGDQEGLAAVAARLLGITVDKSHTRTDWTRRPLSAEQIDYALDDVRFLIPIYEDLLERLQDQGRLEWLREDCEKLIQPELYSVEPGEAWQRLKGLGRLSDAQYHAARLLAEWREERAMRLDRPRGWVIKDEVLVRIAETMPTSKTALEQVRGLPAPLLRQEAQSLLDLIDAAGREDTPAPAPPRPLSPDQRKLVARLMALVRDTAADVGVSTATLATKRDVVKVVRGHGDALPLFGWRRSVIGERLLAQVAD